MTGDWLFNLNLGIMLAGTLFIFILTVIIGYRMGRRSSPDGEQDSQINTIQGATLGLLGLLLAFTFAMSAARYDARRQLVLQESNAIGTTYLRAQMLPDPQRTQISDLLREYVEARLEFYNAGVDAVKLQQATDKTLQIQDQLWQQAIVASASDARSVPIGLFIQSLNEMIDLHAERLAAMRNRVPEIIIYLLFVVAIVTLGLIGYGSGISRRRNLIPILMSLLLIATILMVIIDLDRPRRGIIRVSQESMIQLQQSLK